MRILITGGAGFIGTHLALELQRRGNEVILLDRFSNYYSTELKRMRVKSILGVQSDTILTSDLQNFEETNKVLKSVKPKVIVHLAAQPGVRLNRKEHRVYINDNIIGFTNLLNSSLDNDVDILLYASTSSVYSDKGTKAFSEIDTTVNPKSFYGLSKYWNEQIANLYAERYGLVVRGMRFFTVYGPWGRPDMAYFRLVNSALNGTEFELYGDGTIKRDFTFVSDVTKRIAELLFDLIKRESNFRDIVNIGGGNPCSMSDLIREIELQTGNKINLIRKEVNPSDLDQTVADKTYGESIFTKCQYTDLKDGIGKVIEWSSNSAIQKNLKSWIDSTI